MIYTLHGICPCLLQEDPEESCSAFGKYPTSHQAWLIGKNVYWGWIFCSTDFLQSWLYSHVVLWRCTYEQWLVQK